MRGLRTQEGKKFELFFSLVQAEAQKHKAVFFVDSGEGHQFENEEMECEDLFGWLIPEKRVKEFEEVFQSKVGDDWDDFTCFANWHEKAGIITVTFDNYG